MASNYVVDNEYDIFIEKNFDLKEFCKRYLNEYNPDGVFIYIIQSFSVINFGDILRRLIRFRERFSNIQGYFSLNNCCDLETLRFTQENNIGICVTNHKQVNLLSKIDNGKNRVIDDCSSRSLTSIKESFGHNAIFSIENEYQMKQIIHVSYDADMILCLSVNDDDVEEKGLDEDECKELIDKANDIGVGFIGIYFSPQKLNDFDVLRRLINYADKKNHPIQFVFIRNSYLIDNFDNNEILQEFQDISSKYNISFKCDISEYILHDTSYLVCQVTGKRIRGDCSYLYLNDGVYGSLHDSVFDESILKFIPISEGKETKTTLYGPTCDSFDTIVKDISLCEMSIGDWLCINGSDYSPDTITSFNSFSSGSVIYVFY